MLKLKDIVKNYYVADITVEALKGINLCFRKNEFVSILGPSGCGKTTLLNIIGGLDKYTSGDLTINGVSTKQFNDRDWDVYRNHRIGFIFQSYNLIPHQTVLGNVELALTISGISKNERIEKAKKALDRVGLHNEYFKHPNQLSGGQCQRVAIARALVNEPEILLADEPTGALDTETSVQIMDLIKEIANEKLVIMVTHNPDLAYKYSNRIVKFLDGRIVDDSNPFTEEEEAKEIEELKQIEKANDEEALSKIDRNDKKAVKAYEKQKNAKERAKMSWWTAFKLSARNLWSKRARTLMVGIAGSIGIIGVASVLSVSTGVRDYITSMQDDLLSGNPIKVSESSINVEVLMNSTTFQVKQEAFAQGDWVNVNKIISYLVKNQEDLSSIIGHNDINKDYVDYVKSMPKDYYKSIALDYGIEFSHSLFTDYVTGTSDEETPFNRNISLTAINNIYSQAITHLDVENYGPYSDVITSLTTPVSQCVPNNDYILSQYDQVYGRMPESKEEMIMVLDNNSAVSDLVLAQLGYYSQEEFYALVYDALGSKIDNDIIKTKFSYEDIVNKKFVWYPNDTIYSRVQDDIYSTLLPIKYKYNFTSSASGFDKSTGIEMKIVGIVKPKKGISYGALETGLLYSEDFARYAIKANENSKIVKGMNSIGGKLPSVFPYESYPKATVTAGDPIPASSDVKYYEKIDDKYEITKDTTFVADKTYYTKETKYIQSGVSYDLDYYWEKLNETLDEKITGIDSSHLNIKDQNTMSSIMSLFNIPGMSDALSSMTVLSLRTVGGDSLPKSIAIYPIDFDHKDLVTDYLNAWNDTVVEGNTEEEKAEMTAKKTLTVYEFDDDYQIKKDADGNYITRQIAPDDPARTEIKFTDTVGLIIGMINQMIDIITFALVAFTALSLVVSSVMIAIITYVSVMERIKEIGVIRSLGGRKKDVSHLFNAETFIIGLGAGVIGIAITGLLSLLANVIVNFASGGQVKSIAHLTPLIIVVMIAVSILLTLISGLIPARSAAKKDPVVALRTE